MFGRLSRDAGSTLGVEITSGALRMLHARRQRGRWRVAGWACEALPPGAGSLLAAHDPEQWVHALAQAHRRCATRQRQVALALPASQVICKVCQVPSCASTQAVEAQLLVEAEQLFPFPLNDLALDFHVLQPTPGKPGSLDVLVAACRQSLLDPIEHLLAQAGLELVALELDSLALLRVLGSAPAQQVALLQLELDEVVLHRWQPDQLPLRQQLPLAPGRHWHEAVASLLPLCAQPARQVLLAGASADAAALDHLQATHGLPCRLVQLAPSLGSGEAPGPAMAVACGLALGGQW